jgi:HEAT repeat protein
MSLALIQESAKEVRRLAIAGSPLAVGDFRLKKLIPPLEKAGATVPVFAQVAKAIGELVDGKEAESAARLLNLSTLLNAILYTQGQSGAPAEFTELEMYSAGSANTRTTARVLKPLIEALTNSGAGRFEVVRAAIERGAFNDLRLIDPAIRALDDSFGELADLMAEKVLPTYGRGIVPLLKKSLVLKGKKSDARRLQILHQLDPQDTLPLCKTALDEGSPEVKVSAVACLGQHEDCLPLILEQVNSKNKPVRIAALRALAGYDREEVTKLFSDLLKAKSLDILAEPLRFVRSRLVVKALLDEGRRVFDLLLKGDSEQIPRFSEILSCVEGRQDAGDFLLTCFNQSDKLAKLKAPKNVILSGADIMARMAALLYQLGSPAALEAVLAKRATLPGSAFGEVLRSALRTWPPAKVYDEFAPLLEQKKGAGKEKNAELQQTIWAYGYHRDSDLDEGDDPDAPEIDDLKKVEWDPRWVDAAIKANEQEIVGCLAKPGNKNAVTYLLKTLEEKKQMRSGLIMEALARCQYPKLTDVFLDQVARKTRKATYYDWEVQQLFGTARLLPRADLPRLDEFASKLDEKFIDHFLEAIGPLRPKQQAN